MDANVSSLYTDAYDGDIVAADYGYDGDDARNATEWQSVNATGARNSSFGLSSPTSAAEDLLVLVVVNATEFYDESVTASSAVNVTAADASLLDELATTSPASEYFNWYFLLLLTFVAAGVLGNTLVCLAICLERRLQNVTNYFLLSLAVADLLVSVVVMPFGIIVGFMGHWPFGVVMCNVYVTCDVLACSSSIMHMCFISIGRYLGIRNPLKTRHNSKKMVGVKIVLVWLLSMVISSPITILGVVDANNIRPEATVCAIHNRFFFVFGSLFAFYVPMVIMVVAYVLTVQLLRQQKKFGDDLPASRRVQLSRRRRRVHQQHQHQQQQQQQRHLESSQQRAGVLLSLRGAEHSATPVATSSNNGHVSGSYRTPRIPKVSTCDRGTQTMDPSMSDSQRLVRLRSLRLNLPKSPSTFHLRFLAIRKRSRSSSMVGNSVANEQKASKVLGIVFSTFVVCWAPFFVLNIVFAVCPSYQVSTDIVDTCLWLGYVSSTINPVIYTIFNRTFKEAFIKLLKSQCCVFRRSRYSSARIYRYVDALAQTPTTTDALCLGSPTTPSGTCDGNESIC